VGELDCKEWLKNYLLRAPFVLVCQVRFDAKNAGFLKRELAAARKELGVQTIRKAGGWFWYAEPDDDREGN
jgi:hypothetical protein